MRYPKSYTDIRGTHEVRAEQLRINEVSQAEGPAVDLEVEPNLVQTLDLDWLPFAAKTYHISPNIEDYVVVNTPICPSDIPNRNGVGFPLSELTRYRAPPISSMAYKAWAGVPMHLEHDNEDCTQAYGVVLDAVLTRIQGFGNGKYWKVMGLAAIDKNKHPDIAAKVLSGEINTYSMGALADVLTCSICNAVVHTEKNRYKNCRHVTHSEAVNFKLHNEGGKLKLAYLNAHMLSAIELSVVKDPAWVPCLSDHILTRAEQ